MTFDAIIGRSKLIGLVGNPARRDFLRDLERIEGSRLPMWSSMGALSNISVASWLYAGDPVWWFAGLVGSLISAVWNYALSSALVWRGWRNR